MSKSEEVTLNGSPKLDRYHLAEEGAVSSDPADPRITENTRATLHELDNSYGHQLSDYIHHHHHHTEEKTSDADLAKQVSTATEDEVLEKQDGPIYVRFPKTYFFQLAPNSRPYQIDFEKGDPRDPLNFSTTRKWVISMCAIFFTGISGS